MILGYIPIYMYINIRMFLFGPQKTIFHDAPPTHTQPHTMKTMPASVPWLVIRFSVNKLIETFDSSLVTSKRTANVLYSH